MTQEELKFKLTDHFNRLEFFPNAVYHQEITSDLLIKLNTPLYRLACILEHVRSYYGNPITITSGYRTSLQNKLAGGVSNSDHLSGKAVDFTTLHLSTIFIQIRKDKEFFQSQGVHQVIYYPSKRIIHIGISDTKTKHISLILKK